MLFPFILLKSLTRFIFLKRINIGAQWLLFRFLCLCNGSWLFAIDLVNIFMLNIGQMLCLLGNQISVLELNETFPFLSWIDSFLIFLVLGQDNCRWRKVQMMAFWVFSLYFVVFHQIAFLFVLGFLWRERELLFWGLLLVKTLMHFFVNGKVHPVTKLTDGRFPLWLVKGTF